MGRGGAPPGRAVKGRSTKKTAPKLRPSERKTRVLKQLQRLWAGGEELQQFKPLTGLRSVDVDLLCAALRDPRWQAPALRLSCSALRMDSAQMCAVLAALGGGHSGEPPPRLPPLQEHFDIEAPVEEEHARDIFEPGGPGRRAGLLELDLTAPSSWGASGRAASARSERSSRARPLRPCATCAFCGSAAHGGSVRAAWAIWRGSWRKTAPWPVHLQTCAHGSAAAQHGRLPRSPPVCFSPPAPNRCSWLCICLASSTSIPPQALAVFTDPVCLLGGGVPPGGVLWEPLGGYLLFKQKRAAAAAAAAATTAATAVAAAAAATAVAAAVAAAAGRLPGSAVRQRRPLSARPRRQGARAQAEARRWERVDRLRELDG